MRRSMIFAMAAVLAAAGSTVYVASSAGAAAACAPAWSATAVYVGGNSASQNGRNYTAKWWTQNESPATHSGQWDVWADNGACEGGTTPTTPPTTTPTTPPTTPTGPPTTPPTSPPTSQPPVGGIPERALIGYLHASFANGSGYLRMADVPADWDIINLAFGEPTAATSGDIRFALCPAAECPGVETETQFIAAIRAKRAAGKKVLLSIGGANGQVQLTTTAARDAFVRSVSAVIDRYGLDGVDIDFEGHSLSLNTGDTDFRNPTTPVIVNLIDAIRSLRARYGANFVLTMAPETFFVQLGYQYYGSGPWGGQVPGGRQHRERVPGAARGADRIRRTQLGERG
jgi:hypothetical protein